LYLQSVISYATTLIDENTTGTLYVRAKQGQRCNADHCRFSSIFYNYAWCVKQAF